LALKIFENVLKKTTSLRSVYGMALIYDKLSEIEENNEKLIKSIKLYKKLFSSEFLPKTENLNLHLVAGKRLINRLQFLGENQEAIEYIRILIELFPNEIQFENELGLVYLLSNNINLARKKFKNVLIKSPNNPFANVHYGFILKQIDKNIDESIGYLKRGLDTLDKSVLDGK
jgi:aspartate beta-hydroxylase